MVREHPPPGGEVEADVADEPGACRRVKDRRGAGRDEERRGVCAGEEAPAARRRLALQVGRRVGAIDVDVPPADLVADERRARVQVGERGSGSLRLAALELVEHLGDGLVVVEPVGAVHVASDRRLPAGGRPAGAAVSVYRVCMTRVNVYLPDDLAEEARSAGLNISRVAQDALRRELAARSSTTWLEAVRRLLHTGVSHDEVEAALDAERDEAGDFWPRGGGAGR